MELIHFRILLALKQYGTLNAASETLHLTQSALSHQMKNLEQRLGIVLWRKQGRNFSVDPGRVTICLKLPNR